MLRDRGAPNTNRTCDLPLRRGLLYPLSYRGAGKAGFYANPTVHGVALRLRNC
jgi:hypothetical protein